MYRVCFPSDIAVHLTRLRSANTTELLCSLRSTIVHLSSGRQEYYTGGSRCVVHSSQNGQGRLRPLSLARLHTCIHASAVENMGGKPDHYDRMLEPHPSFWFHISASANSAIGRDGDVIDYAPLTLLSFLTHKGRPHLQTVVPLPGEPVRDIIYSPL